jgi:hypothetical protein
MDLLVESSWSDGCGIQGVLMVGGADDQDLVGLLETVHFSEDLINGCTG